jgi:hypothetical protein
MSIDLQGSRFYMQQIACGAGKQLRLKNDIIKDIESTLGINLPSLKRVTNPDLELIYDKVNLSKRQ